MAFLKTKTIESMYKMDWGIFHLIGPFYISKKYSPATKGYKKYIWTLDVRKKEK